MPVRGAPPGGLLLLVRWGGPPFSLPLSIADMLGMTWPEVAVDEGTDAGAGADVAGAPAVACGGSSRFDGGDNGC